MSKRIFSILILFLLFLIPFTYSVNYVKYTFKDETGQRPSNIKARGYICSDYPTCNSLIGNLWGGQLLNTNDFNPQYSITLQFPATYPQGGNGYLIAWYHDNYKSRWQKTKTTDAINPGTSLASPWYDSSVSDITLTKQSSCSSPVSLSVVNNIRENLPVSVSSGANLDSTTSSAIGATYQNYFPQDDSSYFEIETTLRLKIYKYNSTTSKNIGTPIHEENVVERIYYDDTVNVEFTDWMPPEQTEQFTYYNVTVESDVTDPKCSSKVSQRASKIMRVWRDDPRNECYSLIDTDGLVFSPVSFSQRVPEVGQEVTISFKKLSNYANDYEPWEPLFVLAPQDTNINLRLTGAENRVITQVLPKNDDDNFKNVSVKWTPAVSGSYTLEITADAATCPVITDTSSDPYIQTVWVFDPPKYDLKFTVKAAGNPVTNAKVMIMNPPSERFTSTLGTATYNLFRGNYDYRIEKSPYTAVTGSVNLNQTRNIEITLVSESCPGVNLLTDMNNCGSCGSA